MKKTILIILCFMGMLFSTSCSKDEDFTSALSGNWQQVRVTVDGKEEPLSAGQAKTKLVMNGNGVYKLYDGVRNNTRSGTWLFSDGDWLNMSMDKIQSVSSSGVYKFGQTLVRFTILRADANYIELRIKTFLFERKKTIMFELMDQDDTTNMTGEELLALDTKNKELHAYIYLFKKIKPN